MSTEDERAYNLRNKDKIIVYEQMLPFGTGIRVILFAIGVAPIQLAPNAWRIVMGSISLWRLAYEED